jgi:hypothetical protein
LAFSRHHIFIGSIAHRDSSSIFDLVEVISNAVHDDDDDAIIPHRDSGAQI